MARYLLDTTVLIDVSRGIEPVWSRLQSLADASEDLAVCAISVTEFYSGVPLGQRDRWNAWVNTFHYWDIFREAAVQAGIYRQRYARMGRAVHTPDALLAALAAAHGAIILTGHINHYPMPEVEGRSMRD